MRLVIDTNLMVRALRNAGPARRFLRNAPLHHTILYHDRQTLELREVSGRPRLCIAPEELESLIYRIEHYGELVESDLEPTGDCRDPKDEYILALALTGHADMILTEDHDLLVLDPWRGVRLIRLFEFLRDHPLPE